MNNTSKILEEYGLEWERIHEKVRKNDKMTHELGESPPILNIPFIFLTDNDGIYDKQYCSFNLKNTRSNETPFVLKSNKDAILLATDEKDENFYFEKEYAESLGMGTGQVLHYTDHDHPIIYNAYKSKDAGKSLEKFLSSSLVDTNKLFQPFYVSKYEYILADKLGMPLDVTPDFDLFMLLNSKYFLQKNYNSGLLQDVYVIEGECCSKIRELPSIIDNLFAKHDPKYIKKLLIRNEISAGAGNINTYILNRVEYESMTIEVRNTFLQEISKVLNYDEGRTKLVVQLYIDGVIYPCISGEYIGVRGSIRNEIIRPQVHKIVNGYNKYLSTDYPWDAQYDGNIKEEVLKQSRQYTEFIAGLGARGRVCNDFIILPDWFIKYQEQRGERVSRIALTDPNVRMYSNFVFNGLIDKFNPKNATLLFVEFNKAITPKKLFKILGDDLIIRSEEAVRGVIPYEMVKLYERNKCTLFVMGQSWEDLTSLKKDVFRKLGKIVNQIMYEGV
ncbi:hypothetical protein KC717_04810 [Candidatus Dojkabacteria bacterium]|uniref:Uncharacterized protein n=1 Tax=Candidatus Dojkabacteria bacterium TaxID=2099670 RepID=A0A955L9E6_9BACT|nr:hypothetical protein [Candidatus Dojkabacteria bacterium]